MEKTYVNPNELVTLTLPLSLYLYLWNFINASKYHIEEFQSKYGKYNNVIEHLLKDKKDSGGVSNAWKTIDAALLDYLGVEHIDDVNIDTPDGQRICVQLNDDLEAIVEDDKIIVDCQAIPIENVKKLMKEIKKSKK